MTNLIDTIALTIAPYITAPLVMTFLIAPLVGLGFNEEETDND